MRCPKCLHDNPLDTRFCGKCGNEFKSADAATETLHLKPREMERGSLFAGRYEIIEEIGVGGMGRVYKVFDKKINEIVAVKLIKPEIGADKPSIERLSNELKITRKIAHRNVCRMFDLGEDAGAHFISMEYVSGEDLRSLIRRIGQFSVGKTLVIAKQICDGLAEAHAMGVVHRDLKPQNIMIDREGNVHVMDFGIARFSHSKKLTEVGMIIGTPGYMSPEQAEGKESDARTDIYALGVILYEMLAGKLPFDGETPLEIALKHKTEQPPRPRQFNPHIPQDLENLILKCMEKSREKRYQAVAEIIAELGRIESGIPLTDRVVSEKVSSAPARPTARMASKKFLIPVGAIVALALAAVLYWVLIPRQKDGGRDDEIRDKSSLDLGRDFRLQKKYSEAMDQFRKALAEDPKNFEAQYSIAEILLEQGKPDESIAEFNKAADLQAENHLPYKRLGEIYEEKKEIEKALTYYRECLGRAPQGPEAGAVRRKIQDLETQQAELRRFQEEKDRNEIKEKIANSLDLAQKAYLNGDFRACLNSAGDVLRADPKNARAAQLSSLAREKIAVQEVLALVDGYDRSLGTSSLPSFYQSHCSAQLFEEIRSDAELIMSMFDQFQSSVSKTSARMLGKDKGEVTFFQSLSARSRDDGSERTLFEGTYRWNLEKRIGGWKIVGIVSYPLDRNK